MPRIMGVCPPCFSFGLSKFPSRVSSRVGNSILRSFYLRLLDLFDLSKISTVIESISSIFEKDRLWSNRSFVHKKRSIRENKHIFFVFDSFPLFMPKDRIAPDDLRSCLRSTGSSCFRRSLITKSDCFDRKTED